MDCKKLSVLIVDDEQVVCNLLHHELNDRGYICFTACSANDALTKLSTQHFDIVLLDIRLPGMSGMEVLRQVRSNHNNTAAIVITAVNDVETAVEAMKLGASDYIVKPFDLHRVSTSIVTVLKTKRRLPETRDYKTPLCVGGGEEDKEAMEESFNEMNAIAYGVEARYDLLIGYSEIVTQETIDIARHLGIPEKEIQNWAAARAMHDSERNKAIKTALNKLERNPLARHILGITELELYIPNPGESHN